MGKVAVEEGSVLKEIGTDAFSCCSSLEHIDFPESLEALRFDSFEESGLEEMTLPRTLKEVEGDASNGYASLKTVYVQDGCGADFYRIRVQRSTEVGPPPSTLVGSARVWDLRKLKDIVIPEGAERIGNHWFYCTDVESVTVPASVKEIEADAFCRCEKLKGVLFAKNSRLEKFGTDCFACSGIEKIIIPRGVTEL